MWRGGGGDLKLIGGKGKKFAGGVRGGNLTRPMSQMPSSTLCTTSRFA
ncbi:MAG: hypothetical protein ACLR8P_14245 [Clostridium fessum]